MKTACMVVHSYYPADPRVRRQTEALLREGWRVDVVCLRDQGEVSVEDCGGATVFRLPVARHRGRGIMVYLLEYLVFFALAFARVTWLSLWRRYTLVQAHNPPDFLVFTALAPRLLGARVVLDIHDPTPELYMLKFAGRADHPVVRLTRWIERCSAAFAHHVLTVTEPVRRNLQARGLAPEKLTVIINSADPALFSPRPASSSARAGFRLMYHGTLSHRNGLTLAIQAVARVAPCIPGLRFDIYGRGEAEASLRLLVAELQVGHIVRLHGFVPIDQIPPLVAEADLGISTYQPSLFMDLAYPTKAFEYLAMGRPIIMLRTPAVVDLFGEAPDLFFDYDVDDLAQRLLDVITTPARLTRLEQAACQAYTALAWPAQRQVYLDVLHMLTTSLIQPELEVSS